MLEPMSAAALGSLITTICLATSGFFAVFFKGMSHSRCTKSIYVASIATGMLLIQMISIKTRIKNIINNSNTY